ncbi:DUF2141 domain-containing protein [Flavobacterium collinsii]|jgi:uncharacterized protein (DUF2141 family)|uniref:DUF2141 domain-containing protein n=1 Tax=Flavobacterium collinsii TaxID=1114861 RepID=A0A9W4TJ50_9FLAO|nr:DUF2141 domain-containing protein [Flavobacterium collinsii]CAI2768211.1 conserved exported protein of unknown function [Flavobacterium collinsii]
MKKTILSVLVLGVSYFTNAQQVKMNIDVTNVQKGKGTVVVNVYDKKQNFLKTACFTKVQKASQETIKFQVDLPRGTYAITVFQDLDNNGKLNSNWFGMPKEPVGNSTNFKPDGGAPTFNDCSIYVLKNESAIAIELY